jgi:small subunit ribosomal protein S6
MRRYETFIIIDPDLSDEERSPIFEKVKDLIKQEECLLVTLDEWGGQKACI